MSGVNTEIEDMYLLRASWAHDNDLPETAAWLLDMAACAARGEEVPMNTDEERNRAVSAMLNECAALGRKRAQLSLERPE